MTARVFLLSEGAELVGLLCAWKADKQLVTLFSHLPILDDGGRLVRHHFGDVNKMIRPLR